MEFKETRLDGLLLVDPVVHSDERGAFLESFRKSWIDQWGISQEFVQDNLSLSGKGVLRGLHYQTPVEQGKLVQVIKGSVFDVAVDLRTHSSTFGEWFGIELNDESRQQLWIPPGFAHGFLSLEEGTLFHYKCTGYYDRQSDRSLRWDDPEIRIDWPIKEPVLSSKDRLAPRLSELTSEVLF